MESGKIYEAISNVMAEIGAIGKDKKNQQQGFMYRGIDDVMNALQPALVKNKVFIAPEVVSENREERQTQKGGVMFSVRLEISYRFYTIDGSFIETKVIGEAMDSGDKATNKAMSIGYKYACFQVFCIPTEEMLDPDAEVHNVKSKDSEGQKTNTTKNQKAKNEPDPSMSTKSEAEMTAEQEKIAAQKIDQAKVSVIKNELDRTGVSETALLGRYKVKSLEEITEGLFPNVMSALKKTKSREEQK